MNKSESIKELANALAKAQAEMKNPGFDSSNPHFKSKYASLASVRDTVTPVLSKHGLSVTQLPAFDDGKAGCESLLMHISGEFISSTLLIPVDKANAHGVGSAITYSRRFSLMAIAGVVGDDDDDGNAATGKSGALPTPITPTTDCWTNIPKERHEYLNRIGAGVLEALQDGRLEDAYQELYVEILDAHKVDNDEFVCIWDLLKSNSKGRAALKKMRADRRQLAEQA